MYGLVDLAGVDDAPLALDALTMRQGRAVAVLGEVDTRQLRFSIRPCPLSRGPASSVARTWGSFEPSQLGEQVGAIVLDRGHHVVRAALLPSTGRCGGWCASRRGSDAAGEVEPGDQGTHGRDLVALVLYRLLSEDDSRAVLRSGDEQVLGARIVPGGTADVLPVDGDGVGARGLLRGPGARRAVEHIGVQVGENLDERGRGRGGEAPQTGAVERPQGTKLMLGQRLGELADCGRTVVSGKLRGDRDPDRGQRIAPPARAAEIGHTMDTPTGFAVDGRSTVAGRLRFATLGHRRGGTVARARRGPAGRRTSFGLPWGTQVAGVPGLRACGPARQFAAR